MISDERDPPIWLGSSPLPPVTFRPLLQWAVALAILAILIGLVWWLGY
jgi:hypothetical protein